MVFQHALLFDVYVADAGCSDVSPYGQTSGH